ncbi:MAG: flagellar biosynthetic protein FliQ, partial [Sphingomonas bacterium]|nr:flagellar biosynthetic protein FliQ [Sphingomonas bacterium]
PKLIVVGICLAIFGGAMLMLIADFMREMFARIPDLLR